jgi:undecaprenyl-diphosphatase
MKKGVFFILGALILGLVSFFFDKAISKFFQTFNNYFLDISLWIFKPVWFYAVFLIIIILVFIKRNKSRAIIPLFLSVCSAWILGFAIKQIIMRPRPLGIIEYFSSNIIDYSFPSNHTLFIFAMLPFLNKELKNKYIWIGLGLLVAFSRIYFNEHYLSDVLFGAIIGYSIGWIFMKLFKK